MMLVRVQEIVGVPLRLSIVFENPTLGGLAASLLKVQAAARTDDSTVTRRPEITDRAPLSAIQQRFWLVDRFVTNRAVYNVNARFRITGPLNLDFFRAAWSAVIERQASLRTVFVEEAGTAFQVILPTVAGEVTCHDLRADPQDVDDRVRAEAARPFDLSCAPLWRAALDRIGEEEFTFHFSIHHILMDESSARC